MSAECNTCGSDLVYPEGTWPLGECPVCTRDAALSVLRQENERLRERLAKIATLPCLIDLDIHEPRYYVENDCPSCFAALAADAGSGDVSR